jgi:signal peptidase I
MWRVFLAFVGLLAVFGVALVVLDLTGVLVQITASDSFSMAPTLPACSGRELGESITYRFRNPRRGEIVAIHSRDLVGANITPDSNEHQATLTKRVIGVPGDTVSAEHGYVFVDGKQADSIRTLPFPTVHLGHDQYFVLGDNRSASQDSRVFGPVPRAGIYARVMLIFWPLSRLGIPGYDKHASPPGFVCPQR